MSKSLTTEELIARIAADIAELQSRLSGGGTVTTQSIYGEGDSQTDRP